MTDDPDDAVEEELRAALEHQEAADDYLGHPLFEGPDAEEED